MSNSSEAAVSGAESASLDRTLITNYMRTREESSFRMLYRRHTPRLLGLATRLLAHGPDAEDAVQETWCRAVARIDTFRWESALGTWLAAILIRHCHERWRRRDAPAELGHEDAGAGSDDAALIALADRIDLTRAIAALPDGYRYVLVLHDVEGYTHGEIASLLGIEAGTSKSQLSRARRALRHRLTVTASKGESPHAGRR